MDSCFKAFFRVLWPYHPSFQQVWDCFRNVRTLPLLLLSKPMKIWMFVYLLMLLQLEPLRRKSFFRFYGDSRGVHEGSRISIFAHLQFYAFKGLFLSYAFWKYLISKEANLTSWLSWRHCVEQKCRSWCQVGCVCVRLFTDFLKLLGLRACHCQYNISIGRVGGALK